MDGHETDRVLSASPAYAELAKRLNAEFDRLSGLVAAGISQYGGFAADERATLINVIQEKKAEFGAGRVTDLWIQYWQEPGRVQSVFRNDPRTKAVYQAPLNRVPKGDSPFRYIGFRDDGGYRTFRFSPRPGGDIATWQIRVALAFFGRDRLALQEGPFFCTALLADFGEQTSYDVTAEDVERFLIKNRKSPDKVRRRPFGSRAPRPAAPDTPAAEVAGE